jgi:formamidopyrimidine-DNA glycosylase
VPELPDVEIYVERVQALLGGRALLGIRLRSPFWLRTVEPPREAFVGKQLERVGRLGKRIVLEFEDQLFAVLHLMVAGRLLWRPPNAAVTGKLVLGALDFAEGSVVVTEAATRKRASLELYRGRAAVEALRRSGIEPLEASARELAEALSRENRTLKRALTDPDLLSGVGNAYSDEILFEARLSPTRLTRSLDEQELTRLHAALRSVLTRWLERLRAEAAGGWPERVTAFRPEMAVHGRYGQPCPRCGAPVQRLRYASNEANYCAPCQTGGKLLADRGLSRLLKADWPKTLEELEERKVRQTLPRKR